MNPDSEFNPGNPLYVLPAPGSGLGEDDVRSIVWGMLFNFNQPMRVASGYLQSQNFQSGSSGWQLRPDGAEINGGVSVTSIDIPNTTTANSFHVDATGNAWWGANTATTYTGANAYVLSTGAAVFKNVQIGGTTIQYVITNSGIFSFGDGSDGSVTCDGSTAVVGMSRSGSVYTMTRDVYFNNLTINSSVTVNPAGYRIFVKDTLTLSGTISGNGDNGVNGNNGRSDAVPNAGGAGGNALADGYLKGSVAGQAGGAGGNFGAVSGNPGAGGSGASTTNSLGTNGQNGGAGGNSSGGGAIGGQAGGSGGTATASNVKLIANWHLATLLDVASSGSTVKFNNSAGAGGGGGGDYAHVGGDAPGGGSGGGSGSAGRIIAIYARFITVSATGVISSNGGTGGTGGNGQDSGAQSGGGGGGGAGANGGITVLTYNNLTNAGSITVTAGIAGGGGTSTHGVAGTAGTNGSSGVIYQFQLSL